MNGSVTIGGNITMCFSKDLINHVKTGKNEFDICEGFTVAALFQLFALLDKLRKQVGRGFKKWVIALGFNYRVALRYAALGKSPLATSALTASDLDQLPSDLFKLSWICRLNAPQLAELFWVVNPKTESRKKVVAAVKEILGLTSMPVLTFSLPISEPRVTPV
jgi:hypothetical protein